MIQVSPVERLWRVDYLLIVIWRRAELRDLMICKRRRDTVSFTAIRVEECALRAPENSEILLMSEKLQHAESGVRAVRAWMLHGVERTREIRRAKEGRQAEATNPGAETVRDSSIGTNDTARGTQGSR